MKDQRPLRLGDTVDDYCPRERRLTNHVVTVMQGDDVTHTRCAACDADHAYKHARTPAKRKTNDTGALYDAVLAGVLKPKRTEPAMAESQEPDTAPAAPVAAVVATVAPPPAVLSAPDPEPVAPAAAPEAVAAPEAAPDAAAPEPEPAVASWGHRPLIRATLPRTEGQAPSPRPIPEFTMHHRQNGGPGRRHQGGGFGRHRDQGRNGRSRSPR